MAACEALAAAPAAVDTALALLAAPPRFGAGAPAGACAARHVRPGDAAAGAADAPPDALGAGAAAVLRRGPAGLLASVAAATHPVLATVAGSRWWPRAAAALARLARGEGHGDDALRTSPRTRSASCCRSGRSARRRPWPRRTGTRSAAPARTSRAPGTAAASPAAARRRSRARAGASSSVAAAAATASAASGASTGRAAARRRPRRSPPARRRCPPLRRGATRAPR